MASRLWQFLFAHAPEFPAAESVKETTEAAKAVFELAEMNCCLRGGGKTAVD
ncbi:MAG: hypothetical protein ACKO7W_11340 [Elainella sp.]